LLRLVELGHDGPELARAMRARIRDELGDPAEWNARAPHDAASADDEDDPDDDMPVFGEIVVDELDPIGRPASFDIPEFGVVQVQVYYRLIGDLGSFAPYVQRVEDIEALEMNFSLADGTPVAGLVARTFVTPGDGFTYDHMLQDSAWDMAWLDTFYSARAGESVSAEAAAQWGWETVVEYTGLLRIEALWVADAFRSADLLKHLVAMAVWIGRRSADSADTWGATIEPRRLVETDKGKALDNFSAARQLWYEQQFVAVCGAQRARPTVLPAGYHDSGTALLPVYLLPVDEDPAD
jgi:hypothetical protein